MVGKAESVGSGGSHYISNTAAQESKRVAYNPSTKKFGPMKTSETRNIDHMTTVGNQVSQVKVPTDFSSPTFLATVDTHTDAAAAPIQTNTRGVDINYTQNLLTSVRTAQRSL